MKSSCYKQGWIFYAGHGGNGWRFIAKFEILCMFMLMLLLINKILRASGLSGIILFNVPLVGLTWL